MVSSFELTDSGEQQAEQLYGRLIHEDELARLRANRLTNMAVDHEVVYDPSERDNGNIGYDNLMQAVWWAANGDPEALKHVRANASTHVYESMIRSGVIFEVELELDSRGRLTQHRQLLEEVYENALRWASNGPEMSQRARQETYNGFLAAEWARLGLLEDQMLVVISPYPTDPSMTDDRARRIGFFPETKSCAIQTITMRNGKLIQEVAFVSGTVEPGGQRHDLVAIRGMFRGLGMSFSATTAPEVLASPFAVPNTVSTLDLVRLYDQQVGGTFFGQDAPSQNYEAYRRACRERLEQLGPLVDATVQDLLASAPLLHHPMDAVHALYDLAQDRMVTWAMHDRAVDARVFGPQAAVHIDIGRGALAAGDIERFLQAEERALATAITGSCPINEKKRDEAQEQASNLEDATSTEDDRIPAVIRCIRCRKFATRDRVIKRDSWRCPHCTLEVDVCNGKVIHQSDLDHPAPEPAGKSWPILHQLFPVAA